MLTWEIFREQLLASTGLTTDDLDFAGAAMLDPSFIASSPYLCGVRGRKPMV
jgi:hypothetical protein